jgi:hypothetical protein
MTESLHAIIRNYVDHSDADDLCQDICSWLLRNYPTDDKHYHEQIRTIEIICEDIWDSCIEADKAK